MTPTRSPSRPEFVAMLAFVFATVAFSIDAMLPVLPQIAAALSPAAPNRAQLVLTAFVAGMGLGTLVAGPVSDAIGRRRTILAGFGLYIAAALAATAAGSLEALLAARLVMGLGAAAPRIAGMALVRDLLAGREMARVMSFVNMLFILVPAAAPSVGALIAAGFGWRGVFGGFVAFGLLAAAWVALRQPETLPPARRIPLSPRPLLASARAVAGDPQVRLVTLILGLGFGQMFALLSSAAQLWGETWGRAESFPVWFAGMALVSASGTILNARLVMRLGMRRIAAAAYAAQVVVAAVTLLALPLLPAPWDYAAFFVWAASVFTMAGVTFGNLNALALQRMGHVAGMAASLISAASTLIAVAIAAPVGLLYDGTATPVIAATLVCSGLAVVLMRRLRD